jgi:hypothetical protein
MAVVVRGKTATVEYSVGLNESTIRAVLKEWNRESLDRQPQGAGKTDGNNQPEASSNSKQNPQSPNTVAAERGSQPDSATLASRTGKDTGSQSGSDSASTSANVQDTQSAHWIDAELLARFEQAAPGEIASRIDVTCNGQRVLPAAVALGPTPLHPFVLVVKFELELPVGENVEFNVHDRNFRGNTGAVRYALKAKGNTMLLNSNQAPILVRSERVEVADLSPDEREKRSVISSRLAIFEQFP